jgi:hypothetical protein
VGVESSVSTRAVIESFAMEKKWSGITFELRGKIQFPLNPELSLEKAAALPNFPIELSHLVLAFYIYLWFLIRTLLPYSKKSQGAGRKTCPVIWKAENSNIM